MVTYFLLPLLLPPLFLAAALDDLAAKLPLATCPPFCLAVAPWIREAATDVIDDLFLLMEILRYLVNVEGSFRQQG